MDVKISGGFYLLDAAPTGEPLETVTPLSAGREYWLDPCGCDCSRKNRREYIERLGNDSILILEEVVDSVSTFWTEHTRVGTNPRAHTTQNVCVCVCACVPCVHGVCMCVTLFQVIGPI